MSMLTVSNVPEDEASDAEAFKAHLLSEEYLVDDLPLPPREEWPQRDIGL